jgi:hypothetical protein
METASFKKLSYINIMKRERLSGVSNKMPPFVLSLLLFSLPKKRGKEKTIILLYKTCQIHGYLVSLKSIILIVK